MGNDDDFKTKDKTSPLFLSINEDRRGDGFFVTFPTTIETEARDMLSHFGSYLVYEQKNKEVLKYLTLEAGERSKRALWDPETETAISKENTTMDKLIVEVDNINWLQSPVQNKGVQFLENVSPPKNDERKYASTFNFNQDTSSIKTFSSRYTADRSQSRADNVVTPDRHNDAVSEMSPDDTETVATLSMKVAGMDKHIAEMKDMMVTMASWMKKPQDNTCNNGGVDRTPLPSNGTSPDLVSGGTPPKQQGLVHHEDDVALDVPAGEIGDNDSVLHQAISHRQQAEEYQHLSDTYKITTSGTGPQQRETNRKKTKKRKINDNTSGKIDEGISNQHNPNNINLNQPNQLVNDHIMEIIINKIRRTTPPEVLLLHPLATSYSLAFNYNSEVILTLSNYDNQNSDISNKFIITPIFHGPITLGHWYLAILDNTTPTPAGYVIDSLGYQRERYKLACRFYKKFSGHNNITWHSVETNLQTEVECGPRTIYHISDVIEQWKSLQHGKEAVLSSMSYDVPPYLLTTHARLWAQRLLSSSIDDMPEFQLPNANTQFLPPNLHDNVNQPDRTHA